MKIAESNSFSTPSLTNSQPKAPIAVLFALSTAFIFYGALFPFENWRIPERPTLTILFFDWLEHIFLFDIVQNLLLFLPFGLFLGCLLVLQNVSLKKILLIPTIASFAISLTVELLQTFNPVRIPSLLDITLNVISGFWGAGMANLFMRYYPGMLQQVVNSLDIDRKQYLWAYLGMFVWLGFACYQIYPCIPTLHPQQLWEGVLPVFQCIKGDVPFYIDRLFLYTLQGTLVFFSAKLFLKPARSFPIAAGFITLMLLTKITIVGRYLTLEMLSGCYGAICLLWCGQKAMDILIFENKKEFEVS